MVGVSLRNNNSSLCCLPLATIKMPKVWPIGYSNRVTVLLHLIYRIKTVQACLRTNYRMSDLKDIPVKPLGIPLPTIRTRKLLQITVSRVNRHHRFPAVEVHILEVHSIVLYKVLLRVSRRQEHLPLAAAVCLPRVTALAAI